MGNPGIIDVLRMSERLFTISGGQDSNGGKRIGIGVAGIGQECGLERCPIRIGMLGLPFLLDGKGNGTLNGAPSAMFVFDVR